MFHEIITADNYRKFKSDWLPRKKVTADGGGGIVFIAARTTCACLAIHRDVGSAQQSLSLKIPFLRIIRRMIADKNGRCWLRPLGRVSRALRLLTRALAADVCSRRQKALNNSWIQRDGLPARALPSVSYDRAVRMNGKVCVAMRGEPCNRR